MAKARRAILDDARRRVERALMVAPVAEELAAAARRVVDSGADRRDLEELRAALARYEGLISS